MVSDSELAPLAEKFRSLVPLKDKKKVLFSGKDAVDWLQNNSGVTDRELALALGVQLEGNGLFHHVNHEVGLRDDDKHIYEFPKKAKKPEKKVSLSKKKLKALSPYLVYTLTRNPILENLNLSNNELVTIPSSLFSNPKSEMLRRLKVLHLNNNQLVALPSEIGALTNLVELIASNNQISRLPVEISKLRSLEVLDLSKNKIPELPAELSELTSLKKLYVTQNKLTTLPTTLWLLTNLKLFHVFENPVAEPPHSVLMDGCQAILTYLKKKAETDKLREEMRAKLGPGEKTNPGEKKKKHMARELDRILFDPKGREAFRAFLQTEFSEENFLFWEEVEAFRKLNPDEVDKVEEESERIFNKYIAKEAQLEINIPANIRTDLQKRFLNVSWQDFGTGNIDTNVFNTAQASIMKTLKSDSLPRFIASEIYKTYKTFKVLGASENLVK